MRRAEVVVQTAKELGYLSEAQGLAIIQDLPAPPESGVEDPDHLRQSLAGALEPAKVDELMSLVDITHFPCPQCGAYQSWDACTPGTDTRCGRCEHSFVVPFPLESESGYDPVIQTFAPAELPPGSGAPSVTTEPQNPLLGRVIRGGFRIDSPIGQGGQGTVYRGTSIDLDLPVAVKILFPKKSHDIPRLLREARVLADSDHPSIVRFHYWGQDEIEVDPGHRRKMCYLVMQLVPGENLATVVTRLKESLRAVEHVAGALAYVHKKGVIHRDIKPANILVTEDGGVKLVDFGMSKLMKKDGGANESLTGEWEAPGTLQYMSPEQLDRLDVDHRTDIYSLGLVLYFLLTNQNPYSRAAISEISDLEFSPPGPRQLNPSIPEWVDELVQRMIAKNRDERIQTADEIVSIIRSKSPQKEEKVQNGRSSAPSAVSVSSLAREVSKLKSKLGEAQEKIKTLEMDLSSGVSREVAENLLPLRARLDEHERAFGKAATLFARIEKIEKSLTSIEGKARTFQGWEKKLRARLDRLGREARLFSDAIAVGQEPGQSKAKVAPKPRKK